MDKVWLRRILNLLLYLSFCFIVGTGLLIQYKLLPGSEGGHGLSALGMGRHDWGDLHFYVSLAFIAFIILHIVLSWGWLKRVAANKQVWAVLLGLGVGVVLIGSIFFLPIDHTEDEGRGRGYSQSRD